MGYITENRKMKEKVYMIKRQESYRDDVRKEMRGGNGEILIRHIWEPETEMRANTRMFSKITIKPGCSIGEHSHGEEEEIFYVVKGTAEFSDNGKTVVLTQGDSMLTGGGSSHSVKNIGSDDVELIAMIARF